MLLLMITRKLAEERGGSGHDEWALLAENMEAWSWHFLLLQRRIHMGLCGVGIIPWNTLVILRNSNPMILAKPSLSSDPFAISTSP